MSSAHRVNALLCYFVGHRHSHSPQYPPLDYLTHLCGSDLPWQYAIVIFNFKETDAVTKAARYSSTSVKSNLTSEEKHVYKSNSAVLQSCIAGVAPWVSSELPQKYNHKILFNISVTKRWVQFTAQVLLHFLEKSVSRLVTEKSIFISEVLLSVMSRLFGCIPLFSASRGRMYTNGIEVW